MAVTIWNGSRWSRQGEVDYLITWRDEFVVRAAPPQTHSGLLTS